MSVCLDGLNEHQREAVLAPLGNTLVLAGAGSGKTRVLVSRMAWLIESMDISAHGILAVTFTNKAAAEMRERLTALLGSHVEGLWVGTFHGLCHRLLRRHYEQARLPQHFQIVDSDDQLRMIKRVIAGMNLADDQWPAKQAQSFINGKKDEGLRPEHVQTLSYGPGRTWLAIYAGYEAACRTAGVIDFAEILLRAHEMLRNSPEVLAHYHHRFRAILVDEFQDTNTVQYAWLRLLATPDTSVMAVGDDDQSIYGWRGAKVENIRAFTRDFANTAVIRLEQNYRSTATILSAANALISNNSERMGKDLWTEGAAGHKIILFNAFNELEEARFVAEKIKDAIRAGMPADDMAILYRSNAQSRVLEEALLRGQIPYRIHGGLSFFDRAEIKDSLAYLRLLANADDDAAFERVVNFPTRGIGDKTLDELRSHARANEISLWTAANALLETDIFPKRAALSLAAFVLLINQLAADCEPLELDEQMALVLERSGLMMHYGKLKTDKSEAKLENLQELVSAAKEFRYESDELGDLPILSAFLAHASLEAGEAQAAAYDDAVHLMTLHAAKGLEFGLVFMVGMEEGLFPSKLSNEEPGRLEEERRLCYVGMTRAMKQLVLSYAEVRRLYGREEYHRPSRFLQEIPEQFIESLRPVTQKYQSNISQAPKLSNVSDCGYALGQTVNHAKFGQGVVLGMEGSGANTRIQVRFREQGTKWLVLAYANLQV